MGEVACDEERVAKFSDFVKLTVCFIPIKRDVQYRSGDD